MNRSTVVHIVKTAKQGALAASLPGRPGKTATEVAQVDALADNLRLRDAIAEQMIDLHLVRAKDGLPIVESTVKTTVEDTTRSGGLSRMPD